MNNETIVDGYRQWTTKLINEGRHPTLLTFMFNHLSPSAGQRDHQMISHIETVYGRILTRMYRRPNAEANAGRLPIWFVAPDAPVPKTHMKRDHLSTITLNDGRHYHAMAFVCPGSRLSGSLADYVMDEEHRYAGRDKKLQRLHAVEVTDDPAYVTAYALKMILRGRASPGEVFVLPRPRSALSHR